jgi:hypothetical protein
LGARKKLTCADLHRIAQERFHVAEVYQLTKHVASRLLDEPKPEEARRWLSMSSDP